MWEETTIAPDLVKTHQLRDICRATGQVQVKMEKTGVRTIQYAQTIPARLNIEVGINRAVDDCEIPEELRPPFAWGSLRSTVKRRGVDELSLLIERTILQH